MPTAAPAERVVGPAELDGLVDDVGLGARRDAVRRLALISWRILDGRGREGSLTGWRWAGENDDIDGGSRLGTLDPTRLAASGTPVPWRGPDALTFFVPDAPTVVHDGSVLDYGRARVVAGAASRGPAAATVPELSLPRAWSAVVQALDLDTDELDGWERLRELVAERQAVTLFDHASGPLGLHRALGYPDERQGFMAELCAEGGEEDPWRLLLQLSLGAMPGATRWPGDRERLYLWIAGTALATGDFSDVRVFAQ
jgi:hypothetical protein